MTRGKFRRGHCMGRDLERGQFEIERGVLER
jgi:hypothetical protein